MSDYQKITDTHIIINVGVSKDHRYSLNDQYYVKVTMPGLTVEIFKKNKSKKSKQRQN